VFGLDYQAIRFWIDIGILAWAFTVSGFVIWDRRNKVTQEAVVTLRHEVAKELADIKANLETRRARVDESLETMRARLSETPTRMDLTQLYKAIGEVSQVATELRGTVHSVEATLHMINQHLLDK
jgi:hypothetical protein